MGVRSLALAVGLWGALGCVLPVGGSLRLTPAAIAEDEKPKVDETQLYYGTATCFKAPAVVDADKAFRSIPEYKKILDDKLTEKDARYSVLLLKATKKFKAAVQGAAGDGGYDLVGNVGSITVKGKEVPDITDAVLKKIEEAARAG